MTGDADPTGEPPEATDFDWTSPRWREQEAGSDGDQRGRRFRDDVAPRQRGAIDAGDSVPASTDDHGSEEESPTSEG